jgi:hypothetical protein
MPQNKCKKGELQSRAHPVREYMSLQMKTWQFERWGWIFLIGIVAAAISGLFSHGPLSSEIARSATGEGFAHYERFARNGASVSLKIGATADNEGQIVIQIYGDLFQDFSIENIHPHPVSSAAAGSGMVITLRGTPDEKSLIHLSLRSQKVGFSTTRISTAAQEVLVLRQFVYP